MTNKSILIDAAHKEETRVVVTDNGILQDFDRETVSVQKVKGNIYLAKVTRVEPSLQAAFLDYGQERHGFMPFGDIHPDYFTLSEEEKNNISQLISSQRSQNKEKEEEGDDLGDEETGPSTKSENAQSDSMDTGSYCIDDEAEAAGSGDLLQAIHKRFKIQDVIKAGQMLLVQVTKEERGNKGASMTTYISLAGKYCVLMANTPNKGGVSRKVENFRDRKILRNILKDLEIPEDRSVIIRTAGVGKKPEEIKRDYEYLSKLSQSIDEASAGLKSPAFIHGEDDVIKRCIRDVYNEDVAEVIIEGDEAYATVTKFIEMTMPSGDHNIVHYKDRTPIFSKFGVEQQISALYQKEVPLKSGGSIVIDQTEALVSIDVNSGRSTKESGIEQTAYQTNLEASREIAKQLRLRDLAGLVVIDFIDMSDQRNRRQIERTLRDELKDDRARIQLGRISIFGLLELSRQRLGSSLFETITQPCKTCNGSGYVGSPEVCAIAIFRAIRNACNDKQTKVVYINTSGEVISHIANYKRRDLLITEKNYNINIILTEDDETGAAGFKIKKRKALSQQEKRDLDLEVETGKVNLLEIERNYYDNSDSDDGDINSDKPSYDNRPKRSGNKRWDNKNRKRNDNRKKNPHHSGKKDFNKPSGKSGGVINSLFNIFK